MSNPKATTKNSARTFSLDRAQKSLQEIIQEEIRRAEKSFAEGALLEDETLAVEAERVFEDESQDGSQQKGELGGGETLPDPSTNGIQDTEDESAPIEAAGEEAEKVELFVPSPDNLGEIDEYKFINVLNRLRSAPSFTEGEVRDEFDKLWESLQPNERYFAYITMLGFTQIVLKGASANDVVHPANYGLGAKSSSEEDQEEVSPGAEIPADKTASEMPDTSVAPIVVGESGQSKKWRQMNAMKLAGESGNHEE